MINFLFTFIKAPPFWTFIALLSLWQALVSWGDFPPYLLPSPSAVFQVILSKAPELFKALIHTASAASTGLLFSLLLGYACALLFSVSHWLERGLYPYALFFQTVPIVAIAPLIILWVGHGFWGVAVVAWILSVFPVIAGATIGLTRVPKEWIELFELHEASLWKRMRYLQIPHSLQHVWSGLRVSCGLSVIGAIVGEFSAGYGGEDYGLGYLILMSSGQLKTDLLFASILFSTLLGWALFSFIDRGGEALLNHYHLKQRRINS
jgi:NitT/TauT family transport system permease protein